MGTRSNLQGEEDRERSRPAAKANWAAVFYTYCKASAGCPQGYLKYQRSISDYILKQEFINLFHVNFERDKLVKGRNGKPAWPGDGDIYFNITNTGGLVACVLSDVEVGIDAEKPHTIRMPVVRRCCTPEETAYILGEGDLAGIRMLESLISQETVLSRFFQIWTLKESYVKMTGEGLRFPLRQAAFSIQDAPGEGRRIHCSQPGFFQQRQMGDYWISLCARQGLEVSWKELPHPSNI